MLLDVETRYRVKEWGARVHPTYEDVYWWDRPLADMLPRFGGLRAKLRGGGRAASRGASAAFGWGLPLKEGVKAK